MKNIFLVLTFLILTNVCYSQFEDRTNISGNLNSDFKFLTENKNLVNPTFVNSKKSEKSVGLAALFSGVLPGSGEIYSESYIKGAIFLVAEAAAWYFNISYTKRAENQTEYFQNYANQNWSVVRYANWIINNITVLKGTNKITLINPDTTLSPWNRISWDELNATERSIPTFSHTLYPHGHQQYYEGIGKYRQFRGGWNDDASDGSNYLNDVSPNFNSYSVMRGDANNLYNIASKAIIFVIVNHILSLADAIWTASNYNSELESNLSLEKFQFGEFVELILQINVKFSF
jgi:hypothetical protein